MVLTVVDNIFGLETYFKKINQDPDALTQLRQMFEIEEDMDYID